MNPNLIAHAEQVVQSIQRECLDHFAAFGPKHLHYLVSEYAQHYNDERVHMATGRPGDRRGACRESAMGTVRWRATCGWVGCCAVIGRRRDSA